MIHEPTIIVECDFCQDTVEVQPEYKYRDYSGKNGEYDCSDSAIEEDVISLGWMVTEDDKHKCDSCIEHGDK
jgi:hypothetical protein